MDLGQNDLRANLSFSVEVDRTIELVRWLVTLEGKRLVDVVEAWNNTFSPEQSELGLLKAMDATKLKLLETARMIEQYQNIVGGFLEQSNDPPEATPQAPDITVDQLKNKVQELANFSGFLDKINEQEEEEADEDSEANEEV